MDVPSIETVDGELIPTDRARRQSQRLFLFGFAFLPLLWFVNVWLFWHDFIGRPGADTQIRKYTRHSAISFAIASVLFLPWFLLYVTSGQNLLSPSVYWTLDVTQLCVVCFGLQSSVS